MGPLEIFLIVFGIMLVAVSFIFSEHLLSLDGDNKYDANIAGVTKEIVQKEVEAEVANVIDEKIEQAEVRLDKITNQKIMALGEFSDDVNIKITKNHDEVMFLYDMLTDKEKTLKNTVRDIEALKASIKYMSAETNKDSKDIKESKDNKDNKDTKTTYSNTKDIVSENDSVVYSSSNIIDRIEIAETMEKEKEDGRRMTNDFDDVQGSLDSDNGESNDSDEKESSSALNKNKEILDLFNQGKKDVEIAKKLGIGVGEVQLVIGLFKAKK